jgi:hypothetical protein
MTTPPPGATPQGLAVEVSIVRRHLRPVAKRLLHVGLAALAIAGLVGTRYPTWSLLGMGVVAIFGLATSRLALLRRAFWVLASACYLTFVLEVVFPFPWWFTWISCFAMGAATTTLFYWAIEE